MLTLWGRARCFCDGVSRRDFLRVGALGSLLALPEFLRLRAMAAPSASRARTVRPKAAIMIYLPGGPSHLDTYDPKPQAPAEYRGEFQAIRTNVAGISICEHFPRQAAMMDRLAIIRSLSGVVEEHSDAQVMSGWGEAENRSVGRPSLGAVVSKLRGSDSPDIPPFVSLRGLTTGLEPGYLGPAHRAFVPSGPGLNNLNLPAGVESGRLEDRKVLLAGFDRMRRDIDATGTMTGLDAFTQRAFDIVASGAVRRALDLSQEDPRVRDLYGKQTQFLTARRLIEAGVGCVTLAIGGWDTHSDNFGHLRKQLPEVDNAVATLIDDLHQRGLAEDTVVVVWGEFGRTPRVNGSAGRDHWPAVMSCLLAGGGLRTGQVIGASSARGEYPKDRPVSVQSVIATLYHALGIDPALQFTSASGRPSALLDERTPVAELV